MKQTNASAYLWSISSVGLLPYLPLNTPYAGEQFNIIVITQLIESRNIY